MPKSNYRILLVEDQDHMVTAVEMILGAQYGLRVARSLAQARSMLRAEWPDLMLLDLGLPDGPGTELLQEIRATGMPLGLMPGLTYEVKDIVGASGFGIGSAGLSAYNILVEGNTQALENDVACLSVPTTPMLIIEILTPRCE